MSMDAEDLFADFGEPVPRNTASATRGASRSPIRGRSSQQVPKSRRTYRKRIANAISEYTASSQVGDLELEIGLRISILADQVLIYYRDNLLFTLSSKDILTEVSDDLMKPKKIYTEIQNGRPIGWKFLISWHDSRAAETNRILDIDSVDLDSEEPTFKILVHIRDDHDFWEEPPIPAGYIRAFNGNDYLLDVSNPKDTRILNVITNDRPTYFADTYNGGPDLVVDERVYYISNERIRSERWQGKKILNDFGVLEDNLCITSEPEEIQDWCFAKFNNINRITVLSMDEIDYEDSGNREYINCWNTRYPLTKEYMKGAFLYNYRVMNADRTEHNDIDPERLSEMRKGKILFYINPTEQQINEYFKNEKLFEEEPPLTELGEKVQPTTDRQWYSKNIVQKEGGDSIAHEELILLRNDLSDTLYNHKAVIMGSAVAFMINPSIVKPNDVDVWVRGVDPVSTQLKYGYHPLVLELKSYGWVVGETFAGTKNSQRMSPDILKVYSLSHPKWSYKVQVVEIAVGFEEMAAQFDMTVSMGIWNPAKHSKEGFIGFRNTRQDVIDDILGKRAVFCERRWDITIYQGNPGEPQRIVLTNRARDRLIKYIEKGFTIVVSDQSSFTQDELDRNIRERVEENINRAVSEDETGFYCCTSPERHLPFLRELQRVTTLYKYGKNKKGEDGFTRNAGDLFKFVSTNGHLLDIYIYPMNRRFRLLDNIRGQEPELRCNYVDTASVVLERSESESSSTSASNE